jgi:N1-aminopropylagmatine ureohydrolase
MNINFGGLSEEFTKLDSSEIVVIPVPYDGSSTWIKGADKGPDALLEASANMELYDIETDSEVFLKGIHTEEDVICKEGPEHLASLVKERVSNVLNLKKFPVILGGEHSVSIGCFQAVAEHFEDLTILQFDAHTDLRSSYENSAFNHACVMARGRELAPIVQIGIRSMDSTEKENLDPNRVFWAHKMKNDSSWMEKALSLLTKNVYITIDLDVFDPAFVPATGTPEPGGLDYYTVLSFIREVNKRCHIIGFDVVELCPIENNKASDFLASKLTYQILSYKFFDK